MRPNSSVYVALGKGRARASRSASVSRNVLEILLDVLGIDSALIHLDDVALAVDQERSRKAEIAVPVEQLAIEDVVDRGDIVAMPRRIGNVRSARAKAARSSSSAGSSTFTVISCRPCVAQRA